MIWTEAQGIQPLGVGTALDQGGIASAISSDGTTVVGEQGGFGFQWTQGSGSISLGDLSPCPTFHSSRAIGASEDGRVVVGTSYPFDGDCLAYDEDYDAFRWTAADGMTRLDRLSNQRWAEAMTISTDGGVTGGGTYLPDEGDVALLWNRSGEVFRLWDVLVAQGADLGHWVALRQVTGISSDGRTVAGSGLNRDMKSEAFAASFEGAGSLIRLVARRAAAAGQVEIRWRAEITNCSVEVRGPSDGTSGWQTLTNTPTADGRDLVVTLDVDQSFKLIRLRCP